jgi:hypothetical protein
MASPLIACSTPSAGSPDDQPDDDRREHPAARYVGQERDDQEHQREQPDHGPRDAVVALPEVAVVGPDGGAVVGVLGDREVRERDRGDLQHDRERDAQPQKPVDRSHACLRLRTTSTAATASRIGSTGG